MSGRVRELNTSVMQAGLNRFRKMYRDGHRVMVTCSGGKDSTVCVELAEASGIVPPIVEFPEYDESVADEVEYIECPECGHRWPK